MSGFFVIAYKNQVSVERSSMVEYEVGKRSHRVGCNINIGKNKRAFIIVRDGDVLKVGYVGAVGEKVNEQPWLAEGGSSWRNVHKVVKHSDLVNLDTLCTDLNVNRKMFTKSIQFGHVSAVYKDDFERVVAWFERPIEQQEEVKRENKRDDDQDKVEVKEEVKEEVRPEVKSEIKIIKNKLSLSMFFCPACQMCHEYPSKNAHADLYSNYTECYKEIRRKANEMEDRIAAKKFSLEREGCINLHREECKRLRRLEDMPIIKKPYLWYNSAIDSDHWARRDD